MRYPATQLSVFLFGSALAVPTFGDPVQCTQGALVRSVEVVYGAPDERLPCEVIYDKTQEGAGIHSLWRASNEAGYCEAQAAAFVDKLRNLGWDCDAPAASGTGADPGADPGVEDVPAEIPIAPEPA
ncbi:MAG: hypothetical protein GWM88_08215 [Pseudomonadales bacterium]|nr:hypothetical protein [Pseudomonadales bacterium]NIX07987.1 hypothetical protein [Pseudomonadales bacterium]